MSLFLICFSSLANGSLLNNRHIVIEGKTDITAIHDIAVMSFEVSRQSTTSLKAKKEIDKIAPIELMSSSLSDNLTAYKHRFYVPNTYSMYAKTNCLKWIVK